MDNLQFDSRRPVVIAEHGAVACADSRAALMGLDILRQGGNAADAAVAVAAGMALTTPCSTGLGGDAFCLFYDSNTKQVKALNGSGRAPNSLTIEKMQAEGYSLQNPFPVTHGYGVTVPGAAAAWVDAFNKFGSKKVSLETVLRPAVSLAREGFPINEVTQFAWNIGSRTLIDPKNVHGKDLLIDGKAPKVGQKLKNLKLANIFEKLAKEGKKSFYEGETAINIVEAVKKFGGCLSLEDLKNHKTTYEEPIFTDFKGVRLWEIPPNGQGIVALMALNILEDFDLKALGHNTAEYLHVVIESIRLAFADAMNYVADPSKVEVPINGMLDKKYASNRRVLIKKYSALSVPTHGELPGGTDTVYFTVVDKDGNACSFINSNYMGFGTGIVPKDCGFTLQNRGCNFSLDPGHLNCVAPNKRPYHTIIPAMLTDSNSGDLLASYGVMGGFMQPQGHVQVLLNMLEFGMNPQKALNQPRFCIGPGHEGPIGCVSVEEGITDAVIEKLRSMGHSVDGPVTGHARALFGRGHVITKGAWWAQAEQDIYKGTEMLWAGTDPRIDGLAVGF